MKFQILSDLHLEFFKNSEKIPFIESLKCDVDYTLVAGDVSTGVNMLKDYELLAEILDPIIFIAGNHEYYNSNRRYVDTLLSQTTKGVFLNNNILKLDDVIIIGGTGWNSEFNHIGASKMNDFRLIEDFVNDAQVSTEWADLTYNYFEDMLKHFNGNEKVICMTHNAPLHECIPEKYKGDSLNPFFANDWRDLFQYNPNLWVYGHMHESSDFYQENTRVIENSFGYVDHDENVNFNKNLIIDI